MRKRLSERQKAEYRLLVRTLLSYGVKGSAEKPLTVRPITLIRHLRKSMMSVDYH